MDRKTPTQHLALAQDHVEAGARHIAKQQEIVKRLEKGGHEATGAKRLLAQFEQVQATHIIDCNRLTKELSKPD
jgi:hypothetical protein